MKTDWGAAQRSCKKKETEKEKEKKFHKNANKQTESWSKDNYKWQRSFLGHESNHITTIHPAMHF